MSLQQFADQLNENKRRGNKVVNIDTVLKHIQHAQTKHEPLLEVLREERINDRLES